MQRPVTKPTYRPKTNTVKPNIVRNIHQHNNSTINVKPNRNTNVKTNTNRNRVNVNKSKNTNIKTNTNRSNKIRVNNKRKPR